MKKKILVVDDDRIILKYLSDLLTRDGYEVATAEDGFSALNLLASFTPDIIFFDLIMPRIDGAKLIKIVRNMTKLKDCYLVIVSAAMAEIDFNLQDTGADAYIAKGPFSSMAEHIKDAILASDSPRRKEDPIPIRGIEAVYARQMTKELLLRNRHLETILESMAEGILEVYSGKVIYANSVAISLIGKPLEKILAAYPPDLFAGNIAQRLDKIFQGDSGLPVELVPKTPFKLNGRQILIKILPVKGDSSTTIIMLTDITEYKHLEMQLQHMQKMEAIGTIAAGVAHNFRNTLTEILVNSQLIHMNYEDEGGLHQVADRINTSVKRGSRLVNGLLQFSRKQITQEFEAFNLSDTIDEIDQIIRKSFSQKIDIQTEVPQELWTRGDATSLSQALMNLCNNARDAMPDGGKLTIRAFRENQSAIILVTDTGEGMDRETIGKCFDPFFTSKPLGKGTGLGLSTTFGIIKSHDGLITVDSQMGRGTTFRVLLPLAVDKPQNENRKKSTLIQGKGELVLVVDDESEIRSSVPALLEYLGYRAETASDGNEGLSKFRSRRPDVVLMDINMPAMDGVACIEEIFKIDPKASISLFTGYNQEIVEELSPTARASIKGYIPKPISLEALSQLLAEILDEKNVDNVD